MAEADFEIVDPYNQVAECRASGDRAGLAAALFRVSDDLREKATSVIFNSRTAGDVDKAMGDVEKAMEDVDKAIQAASEGTAIARELRDQVLLVQGLNVLSTGYGAAGRYAEALIPIQELVALYRVSGDRPGLVSTLTVLSDKLLSLAYEAIQAASEGTAIARELGDQLLWVRALTTLAKGYAAAGRYDEAVTTIQQRVALYPTPDVAKPPENYSRGGGDLGRNGWYRALMDLSKYMQQAGDLDGAIQAATEATAIAREISMESIQFDTYSDVRGALAEALDNLASRYAAARRYAEAVTATEEAVEIYRGEYRSGIDYTGGYSFASALTNLSKYLQKAGRLQEAISAAAEAVDVYRQPQGDKTQLTLALENLKALESNSPSSRNP